MLTETESDIDVRADGAGGTAVVFASDYLNKLTGEKIERECRRQLDAGCRTLVVNFKNTEIVNSIGVSILLGVIDAAASCQAQVVFSEVNEDTIQLFEVLGLMRHVTLDNNGGQQSQQQKPPTAANNGQPAAVVH